MSFEQFKDMEQSLENCGIQELMIPVEQDYWLVIHPEERNKAMRVYRDDKDEITFEWVDGVAAQHDPELKAPSCFNYEQAMFTIDHFGIGHLIKVTLTCRPVRWGAGLFNLAPKGLEGLARREVILKEEYLKDPGHVKAIAQAWFLGYQVYSDLKRFSPKANKIKVGDRLSNKYYLRPVPQPIQEFLKTGKLFVLVVDDQVWYAESTMDFLLYSYDRIGCGKQHKTTGWKCRDYKAIACIAPEGITYPHATREVNLEALLREAKDENRKPFREVRDAMVFTDLQRAIKEGGLMSLEVQEGYPVLLNRSGQKVQDYKGYNPSIHRYKYHIGLDVAYYTENPDQLIADAY